MLIVCALCHVQVSGQGTTAVMDMEETFWASEGSCDLQDNHRGKKESYSIILVAQSHQR